MLVPRGQRGLLSHPEHGGHNARELGLDVLGQAALAQDLPETGVQFLAVEPDPAALVGTVGSLVDVPFCKILDLALG